MNSVQLIGNLATDVELRELGSDRRIASFVLAIDRPGPDAKADFVRIAVWNKQAETCGRYLARGSQVGIDGRLRSRSWEDDEGKKRSALEVVANRVQFLSRAGSTAAAESPFQQVEAA